MFAALFCCSTRTKRHRAWPTTRCSHSNRASRSATPGRETLRRIIPFQSHVDSHQGSILFSFGRGNGRFVRWLPRRIRIVRRHRSGYLAGIGTEVLLIDLTVLIDDEGHHSRVAIAGRIGKQRESSGHLARDDIAFGATRRVGSLTGQQPVKVAVEGMRLAGVLIAFASRFSDQGPRGLSGCAPALTSQYKPSCVPAVLRNL